MKSPTSLSALKSSRGTFIWTVVSCTAVSYLALSTITSILSSSSSDPLTVAVQSLACNVPTSNFTSHPVLKSHSSSSTPPVFLPEVQKLLNDLRQARQAAETDVGGSYSSAYTVEDPERWAGENPCRARAELPPLYSGRKVSSDAPINPQWNAVFEEYSHLHRTCIRKIGNDILDVFANKLSIPGCKFVTAESVFGLGNRITYAASVVLYAVITKRVVLFPKGTAPSVMCEPFEGSSWTLPFELEYMNRRKQKNWINEQGNSNETEKFLSWVDESNGHYHSIAAAGQQYFHAEADDGWHPVDRFFCDTEQQFMANVDWVSAAGCLYFLPKLYAIPSFRPTLEALFPNTGLTLTYILRSAFLPGDEAWDRIYRIYEMHLEKADRRVSIQSRYRWGHEQHEKLGTHVNTHISRCLHEKGILPNVSDYFNSSASKSPPFPIVKVMITSLYTDLHDHLSEIYLRHSTVTGESVGLIQLTHDHEQRFSKEVDTQALVEVICLSLSDVLLVTPLSTFGGVAQAYGGLRPWIIEFNDHEEGSCVQSPSVDICYQEAREVLVCPYDLSVNGSSIVDAVPYIAKCSPVDSDNGVVLITR